VIGEEAGMFVYTIHADPPLVVARFAGNVSASDILAFFAQLDGDPAYERSMSGLVDLRDAQPALEPEELKGLADAAVERKLKRGRWGLLVEQPRATALSMLYTKAVASRYHLKVFSTLDGLSDYLGFDARPFLASRPADNA
jgi:hypothetical protein